MLNIVKTVLPLSLFILLPTVLMAQGPPPPATPVDGGLSLLLAAGGVYGLKQLSKKRK
ncbi:MAG: hypothetical protein ABJN36_07840 [Cyclobacteriaceae bacterium]